MTIFFNLLKKKIGLSRIGRISFISDSKNYLKTPTIALPLKPNLVHQVKSIEDFKEQSLYIISDENYLKQEVSEEIFKKTCFIYFYEGTLENFQDILNNNIEIFLTRDILPIIPFNIPTTILNKEFAINEIIFFIENVSKLLVKYPQLNFGITIKIFDFPELLYLYFKLITENENITLLNLRDLFDNLSKFRKICNAIFKIKQQLDNNLVLMGSGKIIPKDYPILVYLGIDIIDCSYSSYLASENFYDTVEYSLPIYKLQFIPCSCVACGKKLKSLLDDKYSLQKIELVCLHNLITAKNYMNKIKQYLHTEDFRAFVEKTTLDDLNLISILKILDKEYSEFIQTYTPITQKNKIIKSLGASSYFRPDFQQFRERLIKSFEPESWTKLIILFPCSAKKPYSSSKSHKKFSSILRKFPDFPDFQEIILTSPLGAIPRQLEDIYPVNSYDISVTGEWDHEELTLASSMLIDLIKKYNEKVPIICHLEGGYREIAKIAQKSLSNEFIFSIIEESITSKESLKSLEELINKYKNNYKLNEKNREKEYLLKSWNRKVEKIIDFQFNSGLGINFCSNGVITKKNKNNDKIHIFDKKQKDLIGIFKIELGQIFLTLKGALKLRPFIKNSNIIVFNGDKIKGNTLFRPGIIEFSPNLFPNSHVIILDQEKQKVIGVGEMIVGSKYIKNSKTGRIVRVYERIK